MVYSITFFYQLVIFVLHILSIQGRINDENKQIAAIPQPTNVKTSEIIEGQYQLFSTKLETTKPILAYAGCMFDIKADANHLKISTIGFNTYTNKPLDVMLFMKDGRYRDAEYDIDDWMHVVNITVTGQGMGNVTYIPEGSFEPIMIEKKQRAAFYLFSPSGPLLVTSRGDKERVSTIDIPSKDLILYEGVGKRQPIDTGKIFSPRLFNGVIGYNTVVFKPPVPTSDADLSGLKKANKAFTHKADDDSAIKHSIYDTRWSQVMFNFWYPLAAMVLLITMYIYLCAPQKALFHKGIFLLLLLLLLSISRGLESNSIVSPESLLNASDIIIDGKSQQPTNTAPSLCWLMSFPNSGTSYTSLLVRTVTGTNTATNYGKENTGADGTSVPVFSDRPQGPFWSKPLSTRFTKPTRGLVLTKTHCGGRCNQCTPDRYVASPHIFAHECFQGDRLVKDASNKLRLVPGSYNNDDLAKAVHLIRDPFDNVVSRFHLSYKHMVQRNETDKLEKYPRSKRGFRSFCKDQSIQYRKKEQKSKFYSYVFDSITDVPCHADFFRYIQWHNLAFITTADLDIPTMILHYENYTNNFNQAKDMLIDFLDQEDVHEPPLFVTGKTYDYFEKEEKIAVARMFNKLAQKKTWDNTKHYF